MIRVFKGMDVSRLVCFRVRLIKGEGVLGLGCLRIFHSDSFKIKKPAIFH